MTEQTNPNYETPAHADRMKQAKEQSDRNKKKNNKSDIKKQYRVIEDGKIKEIIIKKNGNKYSTYIGSAAKDKELAKQVRAEMNKRNHG